jgi:hypothetical protein
MVHLSAPDVEHDMTRPAPDLTCRQEIGQEPGPTSAPPGAFQVGGVLDTPTLPAGAEGP